MLKSRPLTGGNSSRSRHAAAVLVCFAAALVASFNALAQDGPARRLEAIEVQPLPGQHLQLRLRLNADAPQPLSFTIDDPARISLDLPDTALALPERRQNVNIGPLTTIVAAEANGRTRVVLNLSALMPYETRVDGDSVYIEIGGSAEGQPTFAAQPQPSAAARPAAASERRINNIDFRRGSDGAGQVLVDLTDPRTTVDVRQEGGRIVVDFQNTTLPTELMRRLDVTDFATPVATVDALRSGNTARLVVTPEGNYEQLAYQADNIFTLELKTPPPVERQAGAFDADKEYTGDPLTLTFQDIETRAVLQLLADHSGLNVVVSDSVQGNVTLRLQDVPWDQALDIVLTTKGLDMRRNGNVIIVAPADEIAAREQAALEAVSALRELEPLRSEFIQVNYAKAADLAELIGGGGGGNALISDRGSVAIDARTNTLLVQDTSDRLDDIRRLVATLDVAIRQVQIESRIVIVNDDYSRELGVRFGATIVKSNSSDGIVSLTGSGSGSDTIIGSAIDNLNSTGQPFPVAIPPINQRYNVNLPVTNPAGSIAASLLDADYLVDLELSALQAEGAGEIHSMPRIIVANNSEARISQGVQIPYQESSSSGATTTQFRDAVLSLRVTPQITPDDRVILDLFVTKDSVGEVVPSATGGFVPSIDTRNIDTQVLVDDGQTVVLGGIVEREKRDTFNKVPVLGDIPGLGYLFRSRNSVDNSAELLIFVTPTIIRDGVRIQ